MIMTRCYTMLSGLTTTASDTDKKTYLYANGTAMTMTPSEFIAENLLFTWSNKMESKNTRGTNYLIRPAVTLKAGLKFNSTGNGTKENPYTIDYSN